MLKSVRFVGCNLTGVDFSGAKLTDCEMRGCSLDAIRGIDRLRGVRIPWPDVVSNAAALANALGFVIETDD
jgi:uncharacterized protein YjbI with pentapeptide repeats